MLHMEVYPALPTEAASIRKEVFMEEQGFVEEFDEIDHQARHIVVFNGEVGNLPLLLGPGEKLLCSGKCCSPKSMPWSVSGSDACPGMRKASDCIKGK